MRADTLAILPAYVRNQNDLAVTTGAIRTLRKTCDADLIVVNDGSPFRLARAALDDLAEELGFVHRVSAENQGFSYSVNVGLRVAKGGGQNALLVNSDIFFLDNGWLDHLRANDADVVGALLLYPNGLVQHAGIFYSIINRRFDHIYRLAPHSLKQVKAPRICPVTGALMLIKHPTLIDIGVLDENFRFGYEDIDYCHMVFQAGLRCAYEPLAEAVHHESWTAHDPDDKHRQWMQDGWAYLHEKHRGHAFSSYVPTLIGWDDEPL